MDSYVTVEQRANQVADESLESTRRMLQMAEESEQTAANTMVTLDHQGEQLRHVEDVTEKITKDMTQAEKNLKELTKWKLRWRFKQWFRRVWGSGESESGNTASAVEGGRGGTVSSSKLPSGAPNKQSTRVDFSSLTGPYVERITNDAREDQMEENLAAVGSIMGNLRSMAIDMGSEIDKQNEQIDHITSRVETNKVHIDKVHLKAKRLTR